MWNTFHNLGAAFWNDLPQWSNISDYRSLCTLVHYTFYFCSTLGYKPHICKICKKGFSEKGNLVQHERTHSSERMYPCLECSKSFVHSAGLKHHVKKNHLKQPEKVLVDSAVQVKDFLIFFFQIKIDIFLSLYW